ncbi:hypothetical protein ACFV1L_21070 [Kitasatospora sp. NPDC059646]|uniref:hypothetical protein n=1 Tax=Kitasatospora sp. NPDC059646 TaxID=3346893 RepID=UPI0036816640
MSSTPRTGRDNTGLPTNLSATPQVQLHCPQDECETNAPVKNTLMQGRHHHIVQAALFLGLDAGSKVSR